MGAQSCQKTAAAFLIWKRETRIPIDYAYDNQERFSGLYRLAKIVGKHVQFGQLVAFEYLKLQAKHQIKKEKDRTKLKESSQMLLGRQNATNLLD